MPLKFAVSRYRLSSDSVHPVSDDRKRVRRNPVNEGFVAPANTAVTRAVDRSIDWLPAATRRRIIGFYMIVDSRPMPGDFAPPEVVGSSQKTKPISFHQM